MHVWYVDAGIEDTPEPVYTYCLVLSRYLRLHMPKYTSEPGKYITYCTLIRKGPTELQRQLRRIHREA